MFDYEYECVGECDLVLGVGFGLGAMTVDTRVLEEELGRRRRRYGPSTGE